MQVEHEPTGLQLRYESFEPGGIAAKSISMRVTPHVAQNMSDRRSAIDGSTTRHAAYGVRLRIRKSRKHSAGSRPLPSRTRRSSVAATASAPPRGRRLCSGAVPESDGGVAVSAASRSEGGRGGKEW